MEHRFLGVDSRRDGHSAICACGWTSPPRRTAGLAGAAWDDHAAVAIASEAAGREQEA